ncbi:MAG: hypothetical protein FWF10_02140 [Clostridiales bacterium]|nr:hypothetical protein [Clostridiales bacterium]
MRIRNFTAHLLCVMPDTKYAKWMYKRYTGKSLHLEDPRTFDEKIWWLKLHNRNPLLTHCADKVAVRDYVINAGFADILVPTLGIWERPKDIDFDTFADEAMVKPNVGSGDNFLFAKGGELDNPQKHRYMRKVMDYALRQKYHLISREWHYKNVPPKIIAEAVLRDKDGRLPLDYKFFCFGGEPRILTLDLGVLHEDGSLNHHYRRNVYDMNFQLLPMLETRENSDMAVERPDNWERMINICRALSAPFPFCRVDLYNLEGKIYFGEITFYHGGGCNDIKPPEWDLRLGSWIDLNSEHIVYKSERRKSYAKK